MTATHPPSRPAAREERWADLLFRALSPRLPRIEQPDPPPRMQPWTTVWIDRPGRPGRLEGTWYQADSGPRRTPPPEGDRDTARGAVLMLPPWLEWGRAYFHRRRRVESLRAAGYHTLVVDFPGFGASGPPRGFFDRDVADALLDLARRAPDLPLHLWGVSAGGYWSHPVLANGALELTGGRLESAFFEDVSPHLLEWASRVSPLARPVHRLFRLLFPNAFRYLDLRLHAPHLAVDRVTYVSGEDDPGVRPEDTRELARLTGGEERIVPGAGHLEAIKRATDEVIRLAVETFAGSEGVRQSKSA